MARYFPEPVPYTDDLPYIREWLGREFSNVLAAFEEVENVQLEETHIAPTDPREGMIRLADGTDWNPGNGSGFYGYRDGAWFKLDLDSTDSATFARLLLTATDDVTLSSTLHALQIGASSGPNVAFDTNEIQARNNGALAQLSLNAEGGEIRTHPNAPTDASSVIQMLGGRLEFPGTQIASSNANTLDDYEENDWTPFLSFGGGTTGITYSTQIGHYVKIGQFVFAQGRIVLTNKGSSAGGAVLNGLPFTSSGASHNYSPISVGHYTGMTGLTGAFSGYVEIGSTQIPLVQHGATSVSALDNTHFNNNSTVIFSAYYRASA